MNAQVLEQARQRAEICKVFGNVNRILILWVLEEQELSVGDIAKAIDSSLQSTSQHLRLMRDKGILASRRDGNIIYYYVLDDELKERLLLQNAARSGKEAPDRLRRFTPRPTAKDRCWRDR